MFLLFFRRFHLQRQLQRALRAAVAMRRTEALRHLLAAHGARAFALALSAQSPRVMADALSLLTVTERIRVRARLPRAVQRRLHGAVTLPRQPTGCTPRWRGGQSCAAPH